MNIEKQYIKKEYDNLFENPTEIYKICAIASIYLAILITIWPLSAGVTQFVTLVGFYTLAYIASFIGMFVILLIVQLILYLTAQKYVEVPVKRGKRK